VFWHRVQMESQARFCVNPPTVGNVSRFRPARTGKMASGGPGGGNEPPGRRHGCGEILKWLKKKAEACQSSRQEAAEGREGDLPGREATESRRLDDRVC
jgi:hypothetical protein